MMSRKKCSYSVTPVGMLSGSPATRRKTNHIQIMQSKEVQAELGPYKKEMMAIVYSTERFSECILGKETTIQRDHKPLEIICHKSLMSAPLRLQTMLFKLKGYNPEG